MTVAALYVDPTGVYANLPGVEVWDEARDARLYAGPWPVVAHPPCARWGRTAPLTEAWFGSRCAASRTSEVLRDALIDAARSSRLAKCEGSR